MLATDNQKHPITPYDKKDKQKSLRFFNDKLHLSQCSNLLVNIMSPTLQLEKASTINNHTQFTSNSIMQEEIYSRPIVTFNIDLQYLQSMQKYNQQKNQNDAQQYVSNQNARQQKKEEKQPKSDKNLQKPPQPYLLQYDTHHHNQLQQYQFTIIQDQSHSPHQYSSDSNKDNAPQNQKQVNQVQISSVVDKEVECQSEGACAGDSSAVDCAVIYSRFELESKINTSFAYTSPCRQLQHLCNLELSNINTLDKQKQQQRSLQQLWSAQKQKDQQSGTLEHVCNCDDLYCFYNRYQRPRPISQRLVNIQAVDSPSSKQKQQAVSSLSSGERSEEEQQQQNIQQWVYKQMSKLHICDYTTQTRIPIKNSLIQSKKKYIGKKTQKKEYVSNEKRRQLQPYIQMFNVNMEQQDVDSEQEQLQNILKQIRND